MTRIWAIGLLVLMLTACGGPAPASRPDTAAAPATPAEPPPPTKPAEPLPPAQTPTPEPPPSTAGDIRYTCTVKADDAWAPVELPAAPADWEHVYPKPTGQHLKGVAFGNGLFAVVGDTGTVLTSPDGEQWTAAVWGQGIGLSGVAFGAGRFVAAGHDGTLYSSAEGKSWSRRVLPGGGELKEIAYGNGRFVVLNTAGEAWTSTDGLAWSGCIGTGPRLTRLTFQGELFAAFGPGGGKEQPARILYTSRDGLQWGAGAQLPSLDTAPAFVYGNGRYLALASHDQGAVSTDGTTWQPLKLSYSFGGGHNGYVGGAFGNGRFMVPVTLCDPGGCGTNLLTSADGVTWETGLWSDNPLEAVAFGNGRFVGVGYRGKIVTSDGASVLWQSVTTYMAITQVAYGDGRFVAMGAVGALLLSTDGRTWEYPAKGARLPAITSDPKLFHDGKQFVAAGHQKHTGPVVYTSPDGKGWTMAKEAAPGVPEGEAVPVAIPGKTVVSAAQGGGRLVAVTADGEIWAQK